MQTPPDKAQQVTVREAVVHLMRSLDMTTVFGNPGSTELPMFRDWPSDFRYILGLQESVVLGMADGYAQATGRAAFVNLHSAAGLGHALGNLYTACIGNTPLVVTVGQQARSMLPMDPFLGSRTPAEFPRPWVKWSIEPARPEDVPAAVARAYYMAMQEPRGPCLVSVPSDDWEVMTDRIEPRPPIAPTRPDRGAIEALAADLNGAKSPVIIVGAGVDRSGAYGDVVTLAERLKALVWVAPFAGRSNFPERHPLFAGFLAANREDIVGKLQGHDEVLLLGAPAFVYHIASDAPFLPTGARLHQVVSDPDIAAWAPQGQAIVANVAASVRDLLDLVKPADRAAPQGRGPRPEIAPADPISAAYVARMIEQLRPTGSIIVEEAPSSRLSIHDQLPINAPESFFTTSSGGLGYSLPAAVGVALAKPDRRVVVFIGDGSLMYAPQALWSAAEYGLPLVVVVINNGGYAAMKRFGGRMNVAPVGIDIKGMDYGHLALAHGFDTLRVERAAGLEPALQKAFASGRPTLVEVIAG